MPNGFKSKNGATIAGHSEKWANDKRPKKSFSAGQGSRASRNQGYGEEGLKNTIASDGVDTTKMTPEQKMKYFQSLGLMPGKSSSTEPEPVQAHQPKEKPNKVKALTTELQQIFKDDPHSLMSIVNQLKEVPKEKFKDVAFKVYRALQEITAETDEPKKVLNYIRDVLDNEMI